MTWTEKMEEEFQKAKGWHEVVCEEEISEYREEREAERDTNIKNIKTDIANGWRRSS